MIEEEEKRYISLEEEQILDSLEKIDLDKLSPIEALMTLDKLKKML